MRKQELEEQDRLEKANSEKAQENTVKELFTSILNEEKDTVRKLKNKIEENQEKKSFVTDDSNDKAETADSKKVEEKEPVKPVVKPKKTVKHHKKPSKQPVKKE